MTSEIAVTNALHPLAFSRPRRSATGHQILPSREKTLNLSQPQVVWWVLSPPDLTHSGFFGQKIKRQQFVVARNPEALKVL